MRKRRPSRRAAKKAEKRTLTIQSLTGMGEGLAGDIRVPFALSSETVEADIIGKTGLPTSRFNDAAGRADPVCPHFGLPGDGCGGCTLQHLGTDRAQELKARRLLGAVTRVFEDAVIDEVHRSPPRSRRRVKLAVRLEAAGFRVLHGKRIVNLKTCEIIRPEIFALLKPLRQLSRDLSRPFEAQVTVTATGPDVALTEVGEDNLELSDREVLSQFAEKYGIARLSVDGVSASEREVPRVEFGGVPLALPAGAFLQATEEGEAALVREVLNGVGEASSTADLFSGLGTFALPLSEKRQVLAVDVAGKATAALDRAARSARRTLSTEARDLFARPLQAKELTIFDAVVFDPPRAGAEMQAPLIAEAGPETVVAVSCNPLTLARDLSALAARYHLARLVMVDQFGWSPHVEAVAVLKRR